MEFDPVTQQLIDTARAAVDVRARADAFLNLGRRFAGMRNDLALDFTHRGRTLAMEVDDVDLVAWAESNFAETYYYLNDPPRLIEHCQRVIELLPRTSVRDYCCNARVFRATGAAAAGDLVFAIEEYEDILATFLERQPSTLVGTQARGYAFTYRGSIFADSGDIERAAEYYEAAHQCFSSIPGHAGITSSGTFLVFAYMKLGKLEKLQPYALQTLGLLESLATANFPGVNTDELLGVFRGILTWTSFDKTRVIEAMESVRSLIPINLIPISDRFHISLAMIDEYLDAGRLSRARVAVEAEIEAAESLAARRYLPRLFSLRAELLGREGRHKEEADSLRRAIHWERQVGAEHASQRAQFNKMMKDAEHSSRVAALEREKNAELEKKNLKIQELLLNTLPENVVHELETSGRSLPRFHEASTILVGDIVSFSDTSSRHDASTVFAELNEIYAGFDALCAARGLRRLKTIGDAYMVVAFSGHAVSTLVTLARECSQHMASRGGALFHAMRWGLAHGPIIAGIVGTTQFQFDVFGHTVNLAFRLEAASAPNCLTMEARHVPELGPEPTYEERNVDLKGIGPTRVATLELGA